MNNNIQRARAYIKKCNPDGVSCCCCYGPTGPTGPIGPTGPSGGPTGPTGPTGATPTFAIGNVVTGAPGTSASVTIRQV